ncbi:hypothetical protein [Paracoccus sp. S3-43]|uniref:hypothetical protein n=1 Tax=Paracoccus sp. S3-43 TaxID=3030011 RepID=UPI0023B1E5AC|nr:hypothetical protein [Paracoccus sp. S3-43]WEF24322.1 hypothetical protein PXD02_16375 [Paracoccus sp. S3-43]
MATPALADWVYRAPEASDDTGGVYVRNMQGHRLELGCGNGGFVGLSLRPDLRPANVSGIEHAILQLRVDQRPPLFLPVTCQDHGCDQAALHLGKPFTVAEIEAIVTALRSGSSLEITLGAQPMTRFSLAGSSAALGRLKEQNPICDGL